MPGVSLTNMSDFRRGHGSSRGGGCLVRALGRSGAAAVAVAALVGASLGGSPLFAEAPARATDQNTFVEVTPNTAQAGGRVKIRASCDNGNTNQASVDSDAFGRVVVRPDNGFLTGEATIPGSKGPGSYGVNLQCQNGNTATTTLTVVNMSKPSQGPATGGGGTAGGGPSPYALAGGLAVVAVVGGLWLLGMRRGRTETDL